MSMSNHRSFALTIAALALGTSILFGCSDDGQPPASTSGGTPAVPVSPDRPPSNDGGSDAGSPDASSCGVAEHATTDEIGEVAVLGEPPPPLGGSIAPGTYVLSEMNAYVAEDPDAGPPTGPGPGVTGASGRGTIEIDGSTMRVLRSRTAGEGGAVTTEQGSFTYEVDGTSLKRTKTCPGATSDDVIPFTAAGSGLALFVDPQHRELYVRIE